MFIVNLGASLRQGLCLFGREFHIGQVKIVDLTPSLNQSLCLLLLPLDGGQVLIVDLGASLNQSLSSPSRVLHWTTGVCVLSLDSSILGKG